ncbi:MAG: MG2 domain-containing protein, partial [Bacteroidales bacterium]
PTLDLYLAAAWIDRWKSNQMMNPELRKQFTAILISSGKPAAAMWGKYKSGDDFDAEKTRNERIKSLVSEYNNIPEVGALYEQIYFYRKAKDEINWLEEYISRHPNTAYAALFRNEIANLKLPALTIDLPLQSPLKAKTEMTIGNFQSNGFRLSLEHKNEKKNIFFPLQIPADYSRDTVHKILPPLRAGAWKLKADSGNSSTDLYISDLACYTIDNTIYGVDFISGEPLKEAVVSFIDEDKTTFKMQDGNLNVHEFLDKHMLSYLPFTLKRGNELSAPTYISYSRADNKIPIEIYESKIITNKPIYRPGDSLRFKGWAWIATPFKLTVPAVQKLTVKLRNSNYKVVDSVTVMTNEFGTFDGRLQIPALGMNGYHLIETELQYGKYKKTSRERVQVEAYQAPAFQVNIKSNQIQYASSDSAVITGKAISFNGLPVANQEVSYNADFVYLLRFINRGYNFNVNGLTKTDDKGNFSFTIPLSGVVNDKSFAIRGLVTTTITNENGETQKGTCSFIVADRPYSLRISGNIFLDLSDQEATYEVTAQSPLKEKINTNGEWRLVNSKGGKVKSGNWFEGKKFELNLPAGFAVGKYKLICEAADSIKSQMDVLVFNSQSDEMPADTTLLLIPGKEKTLFVGTSEKEIHIRSIWKLGGKPAEEKWVKLKKGLHAWPLPEVGKGYNAQLTLITVKNQKIYSQEFDVNNPIIPDSIQLTIGTFRDHLTPGAKETWSMTLSKNGQPINSASTLAFMYDEALNELAGFDPSLKPLFPSFNFSSRVNEGNCFKTDVFNINSQPIPLSDSLLAATNLYFGFKQDRRYMASSVAMPDNLKIRGMSTKFIPPVLEEEVV